VRARMYFKAPKDAIDKTLRVLEIKKNNYGPVSAKITVRWSMGVYVLPERQSDYEEEAANKRIDELLLKLLGDFDKQGRNVSHKLGPTYAPALFAKAQDAVDAKIFSKQFAESMERLFKANRIRTIEEGPKSKQRSRIVMVSNRNSNREETASNQGPTASNRNGDDMGYWEDDPRNTPFQPENTNQKLSNDFNVPSNPLDSHPLGRAVGRAREATRHARQEGVLGPNRLEDGMPEKRLEAIPNPLRIIGDCPPETTCLHCHQTGNVKRIVDSNRIGGKSETLHEHCAEAWFKKIRNQT
jgi:hypothetical protein